jgi:hypothetical protein
MASFVKTGGFWATADSRAPAKRGMFVDAPSNVLT